MRTTILKTFAVMALVLATTAGAQETWDCGAIPETVTATLSGGTLTVSGTGAMADYSSSSDVPWYRFRGFILDVVIGDGVTSIGRSAFYGCTGLTSVTIPNSVTDIGGGAFYGCTGLTSVMIPNSVTIIGGGAFDGCTGLTSVTIGSSVTSIGSSAFGDCAGLTSVTIPNSVTDIGSSAFSRCTGLTSLTIGSSVTNISYYAFRNCSGLTSVTIPNSVTYIGSDAFGGSSRLTKIDVGTDNTKYSSVDGVLFNKAQDTLLQYPAGKQGAYNIPNSVTSIGSSAFSYSDLTSVTIPNSVTSIESSAFYYSDLTSVTIPNSVMSIGSSAFERCDDLTSVTIPNSVTSIGWSAFSYSGLTSITIPNSVTSIERRTFYRCSDLTSVTIPNSVTEIGEGAFEDCGLTSITIPNSVTSIGQGAFSGCGGLTKIDVDDGNTAYSSVDGVLFNKAQNALIAYPSGKQGTTYIIPSSVTSIDLSEFSYCRDLTSIRSLSVIPPDASKSGSPDFGGKCLFVPQSSINAYRSLDGWKSFDCIQAWEARTWDCGVTPGTVTATLSETGTLTISGTGAMTDYKTDYYYDTRPWKDFRSFITNVVIENGVTSFGDRALSGCTGLTSVTIGSDLILMDHYSFSDHSSDHPYLTGINVDGGNTRYSSVDGVLFNKAQDTLLVYPRGKQGAYNIPTSVTSLGYYAFYGCTGLTSVTIPNSVISLSSAFSGCTGLTSVTIPNSVTSIGYDAFRGCTGLTSVTIPNSVTSLSGAFSGCTGLTSVTIPNSVTSIGYDAFRGCTGLTSVTIPNSVTSLSSAFSGCTGLTSVSSLAVVPPDIDTSVFKEVPVSSVCLYVPQPAISAYSSADVWKEFSCIQAVSGLLNVSFDSRGGSAISSQYALSGSKVLVPTDPVKPDSLFDGWYKDAACTVPVDFDADIVASDMTFYAIYISKEYVPAEDGPMAKAPMLYEFPPDSAVPAPMLKEGAVISGNQLAGEFTAGPNPVSRQSGIINFYRQGKQVASGELSIYDISGNIINKVKISDMAIDNRLKRKAGSWDLRDKNGRIVPVGTYLVRGLVKTSDGKREKVSLTIGVR